MKSIKYKEGVVVKNRRNQEFKILKILKGKPPRYVVQSVLTGYVANISRSALYSGKYKDHLISYNKHGGIIGYASTTKNKTLYNIWQGMMNRCYNVDNKNYKHYGACGVTVCKRWHRFDYFLQDINKVEGYDFNEIQKGNLELDKDYKGFKEYSLDGCIFVTVNKNNQLYKNQRLFKYITPDGETGYAYNKKRVAQIYNLDDSAICKVLNQKYKHHKGFHFEYIDANDYQKGMSRVE